jgi:predicted aminopeptidase
VLAARAFAKDLGLKPADSFTQYSPIDRDVLVWVLSASSKVALRPVTWWFPIVGSIPYKGFFEKEDAESEVKKLAERDLDTFLRPSAAFSTLGWFNDPLLSTTAKFDDLSLVDTVIHEILHNTLWIKSHAPFNETLANFVGSTGAAEFYTAREGAESQHAKDATTRWKNQIEFAKFLDQVVNDLNKIYLPPEAAIPDAEDAHYKEIIEQRNKIFQASVDEWKKKKGIPPEKEITFNNAVIIANKIYLDRPWLFEQLYELCDFSLVKFVAEIKAFGEETKKTKEDPYLELEAFLKTLAEKKMSSSETKNALE